MSQYPTEEAFLAAIFGTPIPEGPTKPWKEITIGTKQYSEGFCSLCNCMTIKCLADGCSGTSCNGSGCKECHDDFEEYVKRLE